ncbi:MAG: carboxypeptidase regulatory-like domain-containing protein, partial [Terriglobia bacterium]
MPRQTRTVGFVLLVGTLVWLGLLFPPQLVAQFTTASLAGNVTDSSGAVVPGAKITLVNTDTGASQTTLTTSTGGYLFPRLPVGRYKLRTEKAGFITYVQSGIVLTVNQAASQPIALKVGAVTQQVNVSANAELVQSRQATVGQLVNEASIVNLPLNGREVQSLVFLAPGTTDVTSHYCDLNCEGGVYPGEQYASVSGSMANGVNYQLDGVDYNDTYLNENLPFPNPDAVQEFNIQTANMSAEYGNAVGGIVNIVTKSGTNQVHGDVFEFLRNGDLNARNFFAPTQDTLKRNQFGGTIGGPIKKDRLFYFGTYQGTRTRTAPEGQIAFVPTAAERQGDFADLCPGGFDSNGLCPSSAGTQLLNPVTKAPFINNQVPVGPVSAFFLRYVPEPTGPGGKLTYVGPPSVQNDDQFMTKLDYTSGKHQLSGFYFFSNFDQPPFIQKVNLVAACPDGNRVRVQNVGITYTYSASS